MFIKRWNIIKELTWVDFKLKYNRSVLGFFWSLLKPFLMLGTLYIVFSVFFRLDYPYYALFLLLGLVLWNFFVEATTGSMHSIVGKANLIKKTYFPRRTIVTSSILTNFLTFVLNLIIFFIFLAVFKGDFSIYALAFVILLIELLILTAGVSYFLSALYVKYRDMLHIWEVLLQVGFWISPIVYPLSYVPDKILKWYMLNPLARIINDSRDSLIYNSLPSLWHMAITFSIVFFIYIIGLAVFKRFSRTFTEEL